MSFLNFKKKAKIKYENGYYFLLNLRDEVLHTSKFLQPLREFADQNGYELLLGGLVSTEYEESSE